MDEGVVGTVPCDRKAVQAWVDVSDAERACDRRAVRAWVDALRSGEFEQGPGALERNGKFCCLGVACVVAQRDGLELTREVMPSPIASVEEYVLWDNEGAFLPARVRGWLGLYENAPHVLLPQDSDAFNAWELLTTLNDAGTDFAEIADLIEGTYLS